LILKYHSSSSILITKMINDDDSAPQPIKTDVVEQRKSGYVDGIQQPWMKEHEE
jgi:hypothetical protein